MFRKFKLSLLIAGSFFCVNAFAGETGNFSLKPAREGWFIGTGIGTQLYVGDGDNLQQLGYRFSTAFEGTVGKWLTPSLIVRAQSTFARVTGGDSRGNKDVMNMVNLHADVMMDVINLCRGVKEDRKFTVLPFIGLGLATKSFLTNNSISVNAGATAIMNIHKHVNLFTELRGTILNDDFDGQSLGFPFDGSVVITAGFQFKF